MIDNKIVGYITRAENTINMNITSEQMRIMKFAYRANMLSDNSYAQLEQEIGNVVVSATETGLISQIDDTHNIFKFVVDETSKVYTRGCERLFEDKKLISLYEALDIDTIMKSVNRKANGMNAVLLQIGFNKNKFNFRIREPHLTTVEVDEFGELQRVGIYLGEDRWQVFTSSSIYIVETDINNIWKDTEKIEDEPNVLGFLPFIVIKNHDNLTQVWHNYKRDNLVKATIQIGTKLTMLNQLIKFQSFKQLVATAGFGSNLDMNDVKLDPATIIYLFGEGAKLETLNLESNYKMLWDTSKEQIEVLLHKEKVNPDAFFNKSSHPTSGYALTLQNYRLDEHTREQQIYYKRIEKKVFNMLKRISEKLNLGLISGDMDINFTPITYPRNSKEILEETSMKINMGLTSLVDEIMKLKKLTKEEAIKQLKENREYLDLWNGYSQQTDGGVAYAKPL